MAKLRNTDYMQNHPQLREGIWIVSAGLSVAFWILVSWIAMVEEAYDRNRLDIGLVVVALQGLLFTNPFTIDGLHVILFIITAIVYSLFMFFFGLFSFAIGLIGLLLQSGETPMIGETMAFVGFGVTVGLCYLKLF